MKKHYKNKPMTLRQLEKKFPATEILIHLDPHGHTDREGVLPSHITEKQE